jgi:cysteine-rich repeat protein
VCGDGIVHAGVEACDDGNLDDTDGCLTSCASASCGDGVVQAGVEGCDDGNDDDGDACVSTCVPASCGDGFVRTGLEECDDGNADEILCTSACLEPTCTDDAQNGTETGTDCGGSCPDACGGTITGLGANTDVLPVVLATIPARAGRRIRVTKIGMCGDADTGSGAARMVATDGTSSWSWVAGQNTLALPATYTLTPTPATGAGSERGFTYMAVDHLLEVGASVTISLDAHNDWDGRYCQDTDEDGVAYGPDAASSLRAWVKYRYE